jgi:tight adherence protein B
VVSAVVPAAAAAALAVLALWEALAAVEALAVSRALAALVVPLVRAWRDGSEPSLPERRRLAFVATAALLAGGWLLAGPLAAAAAAVCAPWALTTLLRRRRRHRRAELERAAPALARAIADALGAGHAVRGALAEAARGVESPVAAAELRAVTAMLELGAPTEHALERLRLRAGCRACDTLVAAILLQRDAGGDLATLLRRLAATQAQAARLADDARAATAQARFTGLVVALLPAGGAALAELASPGALGGLLRVPLAAWLAGFALLLQALGYVAIRRLARVAA